MADTFEAWCTPVELPLVGDTPADHVFIYAPNNGKSFGCWGSSNREDPDAAQAVTARGDKAYCKANHYRGLLDSAWLGIYAVNGVCHQSANLFLYPTNATLPLNKKRPRAVIATHALWGVYGTYAPGAVAASPAFFAEWLARVYTQAYLRCRFSFFKSLPRGRSVRLVPPARKAPKTVPEKIRALYEARPDPRTARARLPVNFVAEEMNVVLGHYLRDRGAPPAFRKTHEEILGEKDRLLTDLGLSGVDDPANLPPSIELKRFVNGLNDLAAKAQDALRIAVGKATYRKLNGDDKVYAPVSPAMAKRCFGGLGVKIM